MTSTVAAPHGATLQPTQTETHSRIGPQHPVSNFYLTPSNQTAFTRKVEHYVKPRSCIRKSQRSLIPSHYPGSLSYRSQHRPSLITPDNPIKPIPTKPVKRWNFRKARWDQFTNLVDSGTDSLPPPTSSDPDLAYSAFCKLIIMAAEKAIPRGFRRRYIPNWDEECDIHYNEFLHAEPGDEAAAKALDLTDCLDKKRRERWEETVQGIDFTHSSRMAWKTFNRLTGRSSRPTQCPVSANSIAEQLLANGRLKDPAKDHTRSIKQETTKLW